MFWLIGLAILAVLIGLASLAHGAVLAVLALLEKAKASTRHLTFYDHKLRS